jgi:protease-4
MCTQQPYTQPPAPKPKRRWIWGCGILGCLGLIALVVLMLVVAAALSSGGGFQGLGEKVAVIRVQGVISAGGMGLFGGSSGSSERLVPLIRRVGRDKRIKALVLRVDSPGGSAAASQEIFDELMKVRRQGKPIVASMGDVAASGGYYVACAADHIVANGSTLTGSIGVIYSHTELSELFKKIGWRQEVIKSGTLKDLGSPSRPLTDEERKVLKGVIDDIYDQFVTAVSEGRKGKLTKEQIRRLADGRVYTGRQALKLKLVDELGNYRAAIQVAARKAGIEGEPQIVDFRRPGLLSILFGDMEESALHVPRHLLLYSPEADALAREMR